MEAVTAPRRRSPGQWPSLPWGVPSLLILAVQVLMVGSTCPRDVTTLASKCFTSFSFEYQNMKRSPHRLCCGLDAETLRAFCSSYTSGMQCIKDLKNECPDSRHGAIDRALTNLHGGEEALEALCDDDTNIEVYARHQSCFTRAGPASFQCFQNRKHLNGSVRLMATVNVKRTELSEFCSDMRGILQCIQSNVRRQCGKEAAGLTATLVKPMVRDSTKCDYRVVTKPPSSRQDNRTPSVIDGSRHTGTGSGSSSLVLAAEAIFLLCLSCVLQRTVLSLM